MSVLNQELGMSLRTNRGNPEAINDFNLYCIYKQSDSVAIAS